MTAPKEPSDWPIVRPQLLVGHIGCLFYVVLSENADANDKAVLVRELARGLDARNDTDRVAVMYCVGPHFGSSVEMLRGLSSVVAERVAKVRRTSAALAMITRSTFARAGLRTVLTLGRLPYPTRVFEDPRQGIVFLDRFVPGLLATRTYEQLLKRVQAAGLTEHAFGSNAD